MSHDDPPAGGGTYTLVVRLSAAATVEVGALGDREFPAGRYAYTGSALGPGGFARVDRHRELAAGERTTRHWHVDYLLGHPTASIEQVLYSGGVDAECEIAAGIDGDPVAGFGASDCGCSTHLWQGPSDGDRGQAAFVEAVIAAHRAARDDGEAYRGA
ncbi:MAG: GIY-YIG nuclease family protein [Haloarculaceae archaeon]